MNEHNLPKEDTLKLIREVEIGLTATFGIRPGEKIHEILISEDDT